MTMSTSQEIQDSNASRFFIPYFASFYSRAIYREVATFWRMRLGLYTAIMVLIAVMPICFKLYHQMRQVGAEIAKTYGPQIPDLTIQNGVAHMQAASPVTILDPKTNEIRLVIDTTGGITQLSQTKADALLTEKMLYIRGNQTQDTAISLTKIGNITLGPNNLKPLFTDIPIDIIKITLPIFWSLGMLYAMGQAICNVLLSWRRNKKLPVPLSFRQVFILAIIALTPAYFIVAVLEYLKWDGGHFINLLALLWVISFAYLRFALNGFDTAQKVKAPA